MNKLLLTVIGATGNQGGSVIKSVLSHPFLSNEFRIRGLTRDPSKPAGQALSEKGVEVVQADLNNKESLRKALAGSHSVFSVTNFWEKASKDVEVQQGKNVADICKELNVQHLIWSSLPSATILSNGKLLNIPHFDGKAEVDDYIRELNIPMTSFIPGFFMSNLKDMIQKGDDSYTITLPVSPSTAFPLFDAANDTGKFVAGILLNRSSLLNGTVLGATAFLPVEEIANTFEKKMKKKFKVQEVPGDIWKSFLPAAMAQEMLENLYLVRDYQYFGPNAEKQLEQSLKILPDPPTSLEEFIDREAPLG